MVIVLEEEAEKYRAPEKACLESLVGGSAAHVRTRDGLVAVFEPQVYSKLKQSGAVRDGEQHWFGGTIDYTQGGHDIYTEPDSDYELPEDSKYQLIEHQNNQQH